MAVVTIDGKQVTLPDEIVELGKEAVRAALEIDFPGAANADIRIEGAKGSAPATVKVSKRAAPKQNLPQKIKAAPSWYERMILALLDAPDYVNPAIALAYQCQQAETRGDTEFFDQMVRRGVVERAINEGEREARAVHQALGILGHSKPTSSRTVPLGF
jgi:aminoglycoside phosphotransferase (APT) family kinase protein